MFSRQLRRINRAWRHSLRKRGAKRRLFVGGVIAVSLVMMHGLTNRSPIDPTAYQPLLNAIAKGESGGNYNAYFGNPSNTRIRFTDMTIAEVLDWQADYVRQGSVSSAVGKYQIINTTLDGLVRELALDTSLKFDEAMQDRLAIALLERRGAIEYVNRRLSREQFAANIAKEWAALPKMTGPNPHDSFYSGDGVNASTITIDEINSALGALEDTINL